MKVLTVTILLSVMALASLNTSAQEPSAEAELAKIEVFGGYAFLRADGAHGRANLNGWTLSLEGNLNRKIALVADFDGTYGENQNSHSALFGPKFTARSEKLAPFVHTLAGIVREEEEGHAHYGFGLGLGGGLDYDLNRRFSIRVAQLDYEYSYVESSNHHNFRFATGIVIKFGRK
jgi:hypothetical protein